MFGVLMIYFCTCSISNCWIKTTCFVQFKEKKTLRDEEHMESYFVDYKEKCTRVKSLSFFEHVKTAASRDSKDPVNRQMTECF